MNNTFYGVCLKNVSVRLKIRFFGKIEDENFMIKKQSKLTFNGFHKTYPNYDSYTFKQNEVPKDKPIFKDFLY